MKLIDLLKNVLLANDTEKQGIISFDGDYKEFVGLFTSDKRAWVNGQLYKGKYLYYYGDTLPSEEGPDASIISGGETIVFLYRIDDF